MRLTIAVMTCITSSIAQGQPHPSVFRTAHKPTEVVGSVGAVLKAAPQPYCLLILLTDGAKTTDTAFKEVKALEKPCLASLFQVTAASDDANATQISLTQALDQAQKMRRRSWFVTVLVVSENLKFLAALAEQSLRSRLLVWDTRLLLLSQLPLAQLQRLLHLHWTYTMMRAMFIIPEDTQEEKKRSVYVYLPYSRQGAQLRKVASWTPTKGLLLLNQAALFPEKFGNFHGATINITALPFAPYWIQTTEEAPDGSSVEKLTGTDYLMFKAVADSLNFTTYNIPTNNWMEVTLRVEERRSFIAPVFHLLLPERAARYDFTFVYEYAAVAFSLTKPGLKPAWQNLYYPLSSEVWLATGVLFLVMSASFIVASRVVSSGNKLEVGQAIVETLGILMEENLSKRLPRSNSGRVLVAGWLMFAFIIGTVYRGNLTAALTLPKYPPRPETIEQLVNYVDRVTMPPYGEEFRRFFLSSGYPVFEKLGHMLHVVPTISEGVKQTLDKNQAHLDTHRYHKHYISKNMTRADGTTRLYIGRQGIIPGISAWPVPHDAPYTININRCIMAVIEGGLYEQWSEELLNQARLESSRKKREYLAQQRKQGKRLEETQGDSEGSIKALNLVHMQGPLMLLVLGVILSGVAFFLELVAAWYTARHQTSKD